MTSLASTTTALRQNRVSAARWFFFALAPLAFAGCGGSAPPAAQAGFSAPTPTPAAAPVTSTSTVPTSAALSQPNSLALPCQTDAQCLTHRCNVAAGKCAWPCQADSDCNPGNRCLPPMCIPSVQ